MPRGKYQVRYSSKLNRWEVYDITTNELIAKFPPQSRENADIYARKMNGEE